MSLESKKQGELQRELAYKLKKKGMTLKRFREKHLTDEEWWQDEDTGAIHWTGHAAEKLAVFLEEPVLVPEFIDVSVMKRARNKRFAVCAHFGKKVYVLVPRRMQKRIRRGMKLKVEVITDASGNRSYREQSLAAK